MDEPRVLIRLLDALEVIAAGMEELVVLKEYELGVRVEYEEGDPYVQANEVKE
jgi:hypothetical protein